MPIQSFPLSACVLPQNKETNKKLKNMTKRALAMCAKYMYTKKLQYNLVLTLLRYLVFGIETFACHTIYHVNTFFAKV